MSSPRLQLTREVRFQLVPDAVSNGEPVRNSWSGWLTSELIAPFVTVRITISGTVGSSGFVENVKTLDGVVRDTCATPLLEGSSRSGSTVACRLFDLVSDAVPEGTNLTALQLSVTPYQSVTVNVEAPEMAILTQQFEFSAAHRLHCGNLSDEDNRQLFGKCNHVNGHGHNYVVDVSVERPAGDDSFDLRAFERAVCEHAIDYLDHKFLNIDIAEFESLNPTVENIAGVVWDRLEPVVRGLHCVRVYETPKTWADVMK